MKQFQMNGNIWTVKTVYPFDPMLVDRTNTLTIGTTDPNTGTVYLSKRLQGDLKTKVLIHELGHCALCSYNLLDDIHRMVYPEYWIDAEEWICDFIANYGFSIFSIGYRILGYDAIQLVPQEFERRFA